jgi:hypothetical protein
MIKLRRISWTKHEAHKKKRSMHIKCWSGNFKVRSHVEDSSAEGKLTSKWRNRV